MAAILYHRGYTARLMMGIFFPRWSWPADEIHRKGARGEQNLAIATDRAYRDPGVSRRCPDNRALTRARGHRPHSLGPRPDGQCRVVKSTKPVRSNPCLVKWAARRRTKIIPADLPALAAHFQPCDPLEMQVSPAGRSICPIFTGPEPDRADVVEPQVVAADGPRLARGEPDQAVGGACPTVTAFDCMGTLQLAAIHYT